MEGRPGRAGDRLLVTYSLSRRARTALQVVDAQGRAVATLLPSGSRSRGDHQLLWDGSDGRGAPLPPGPYVIQAQARTLTSAVSTSATVALGGPDRSAVQVGGTYGMYGGYGAPPPGTPPQGRYVSGAGERAAGTDDPPPTPRTRLRGRN